ncbi:hypothetical protein [Photorhabdus tasmaniensis]|uniref:hypothetical protein n=1 Tax=Photorhabdus tasmaniensis TaxID=1004159 RepID=UPI0010F0BD67
MGEVHNYLPVFAFVELKLNRAVQVFVSDIAQDIFGFYVLPRLVKAFDKRSEGKLFVSRSTIICAGAVRSFNDVATWIISSHCSSTINNVQIYRFVQ